MNVRAIWCFGLQILLGLSLVSGCRTRELPPDLFVRSVKEDPANQLQQASARLIKPRQSYHVLALSGGGMYGAFSAGVINGWTKSGLRPKFDVVTGVSTGALIAPMVFLGPDYDGLIESFYTKVQRRDIFRYRLIPTIPFRDAVATTEPLRELISFALTRDLVKKIAEEHAQGRRLYVGTTNIDTKRFIVWDIGAIASRGGEAARTLIIDVLVASCSLPGVFPPVPIDIQVDGKEYRELHVDGGVIAPVFIPTPVFDSLMVLQQEDPKRQIDVYVIQAGKSFPEAGPVVSRVLPVISASTSAIFSVQTRREISNLFHMTQMLKGRFHLATLPADYPLTSNGLSFDREEMNRLFKLGFKTAEQGEAGWKPQPDERGPGEREPIRTGNRFRTTPLTSETNSPQPVQHRPGVARPTQPILRDPRVLPRRLPLRQEP